jgi:hypothetical protein
VVCHREPRLTVALQQFPDSVKCRKTETFSGEAS